MSKKGKKKGWTKYVAIPAIILVLLAGLYVVGSSSSSLMASASSLLASVTASGSSATPVISSVVSAAPGGWAKLRGKNLSTNVTIVGATYSVLSPKVTSDNARVDFKIDPREVPGSYSVYVTNDSGKGNTMPFVVVGPQPGSVADLSATLSAAAPLSGKYLIYPAGGPNKTVLLSAYKLKSSIKDSTVNSLTFRLGTTPGLGSNLGSSMQNFKLSDGANSYYGALSGNNVTFSNLKISLPQDITKDLILSADITASSSSFYATTYLDISKIAAVDSNYNTPTYGGANLAGVTTDLRGSTFNFTPQALAFYGAPSPMGRVDNGNNPFVKAVANYTLTLSNSGYSPLYVSKNNKVMFSTYTTPANNSSSSVSILVEPTAIAGDTSVAYMIPAGGSRVFSVTNIVGRSSYTSVKDGINVTAINYGTSPNNPTGLKLTSGISALSSSVVW